ncbi:hypothetical protein Q8A67_000273 [Cirrhinus molitorella]|uniref:Uncharacterized protein n=1 Tax=Cirrhinus molitorella TaxID=172907 RepID=A0AA88QJ79_9TELE|nr:hypothetical protein Q8A67_000273 [Cirrhinus molitorella]
MQACGLILKEGSIPTLRGDKANAFQDSARVHHVACQTDTPKLCTVATQLSITTLRPHYRSTAVQATMSCPDDEDDGVGTSQPQPPSPPTKMPRLELKEEEEDQESHWVLQMIV